MKTGKIKVGKSLKSFTIKKLYHVNVQTTVSSFIKEIFSLNCILKGILIEKHGTSGSYKREEIKKYFIKKRDKNSQWAKQL